MRRAVRMLRLATVVLCAGALLGALGGAGCTKEKKNKAKTRAKASGQKVEAPREVLLTVGLRSPDKTIDNALALVSQLVPLPLTRGGLLDLFAQKAKLPRELVDTIDTGKPLWLLGLDDKRVKDVDPAVLVFPLRSRKGFMAALEKRLERKEKRGKLVLYKPRPGQVGQHEVLLHVSDTHVVVPSSQRAFEVVERYVLGTLPGRTPGHDVELRLLMNHLMQERGDEFETKLDRAMDQMRANIQQQQSPVDQKRVARVTEKTVRRWADALKSTRELVLAADVTREELAVTLRALAKPGGRLASVVKRQRPGAPFGQGLLPRDAWLVFADRGNPAASKEGESTWQPLLRAMFKGLEDKLRERMIAAASAAGESYTGDVTLAVHRPVGGTGWGLSMAAKITDAARARQALAQLADSVGAWAKMMMKRSGEPPPKGFKVERKPFARGEARGERFDLHLALPDERRQEIDTTVGMPLTLAVATIKDKALLTVGKGAVAQLEAMADAAAKDKTIETSLEDNGAFQRARRAGDQRVGLLYVSAIDLGRWFEGTRFKQLAPLARALADQRVTAAPSLDWGVDRGRTAFDLTLRLPAAHFKALKPALQQLQNAGATPDSLLQGAPGGGSWKNL